MIKVEIDSIRVSMLTEHRLVILKDVSQDRYLMTWIGICDADALVVKLTGMTPVRPLTYDFFWQFMRQTRLSVERVYIHSLIGNYIYTQVIVARSELGLRRRFTIDCKVGDALLTALYFDVPIYVSPDVMQQLAIQRDELPSQEMDLAAWSVPPLSLLEIDAASVPTPS